VFVFAGVVDHMGQYPRASQRREQERSTALHLLLHPSVRIRQNPEGIHSVDTSRVQKHTNLGHYG